MGMFNVRLDREIYQYVWLSVEAPNEIEAEKAAIRKAEFSEKPFKPDLEWVYDVQVVPPRVGVVERWENDTDGYGDEYHG